MRMLVVEKAVHPAVGAGHGLLTLSMTTLRLVARPVATAAATTPASPAYTVDDLGAFSGGGGATLGTGINAAGDVSGYGIHGAPGYTAFRWPSRPISRGFP